MSEPASELVDPATHEAIMAAAKELSTLTTARDARDLVNQPTINDWLEAMGFDNPRFRAGEAPPTMAQVWTMYGLGGKRSDDDPLHLMMNVLTDLGFTGVLGTNSEQTYDRYLRVGEQVRIELALESVVGPKATGMGVGILGARRLMDQFDIRSDPSGTRVMLGKLLPRKVGLIGPHDIARVVETLARQPALDPMEEVQRLASPLPSPADAKDPRGAPCCNRGLSFSGGFTSRKQKLSGPV